MSTTQSAIRVQANGTHKRGGANGRANGSIIANGGVTALKDQKTDYTRWRLKNERGCQTWHYLETEEEVREWPQSTADKYWLGLDTEQPDLPPARTPFEAAENGLTFFSQLQLPAGNWACEYGGPMFLLPGLVITWYVTETPILESYAIEIKAYLFARQHPEDGGWGLHIEGVSSVFGTALNYTCLRLLGVEPDDPRMVKAREMLWKLGGALNGPHWAKWWLSVLGVLEWDVVNPVPPELWLLPDWVPIHPWRWWIHMRQVFLPMSYIYSKKWSYPLNDLTRQLRAELLTQPFDSITFAHHRNDIAPADNYHPKSWILLVLFWFLAHLWMPLLRPQWLVKRAEAHAWWLIVAEDENTNYANLGPVNGPMNTLCSYIHSGPDSFAFREHLKTLHEFMWMKSEGMLMNGTNGVQVWDTAFATLAICEAGFATSPKWQPMLTRVLDFFDDQQLAAECRDQRACYRQQRRGGWPFSTAKQGYVVSDCTAEALKCVLLLQNTPGYPTRLPPARLYAAIDVLLTMQNRTGGCASYEPTRGSPLLEHLNAAEVFGRIMIEYDYPECTTAVVTALQLFSQHHPAYRAAEIAAFTARAIAYIRAAQRPDGSWYGSWGICFTYAAMFALEALASVGDTYASGSPHVHRACTFLLSHQNPDGGWGETYRSCETGTYSPHSTSQVVQTAWAVIALLEAGYPDRGPVERGVRLIMARQKRNGEWPQEAIEGVFNKSCMISYPNYKFIFPIRALGLWAGRVLCKFVRYIHYALLYYTILYYTIHTIC
ncbi:lanosterol synthase [Massariosphaeria phaeospora]|uniref:Terpene cyclase/mutase family member n=1 Tax=Massariosphaeria phaeospora TaxID=100035 RepID=A0A7C8I5A9_9PLEO|nr:lanosterol synthase [Massariosphaeria phaeospora]